MSGGRRQRTIATPLTVTGRVLAILGAFSAEHCELGLVEISRRTGLAASTTHRLVAELNEWGALERAPDRRYRVGFRLRELAVLASTTDSAVTTPAAGPSPVSAPPVAAVSSRKRGA